MKSMMVTGIGSEQDFKTGESKFLLVLNDGELRIPISEPAAEIIIKIMYQETAQTESVPQYEEELEKPVSVSNTNESYGDEDDGVGQI